MLRDQLMQHRDTRQTLRQPPPGHHPSLIGFDFDVVMGLSPIIPNKQHRAPSLTYLINKPRTAEKTCCDLMDQCSTGTTSHQHYRPPHQPPGHDLVAR